MGKFSFLFGSFKNSIQKDISAKTGVLLSKPLQVSIQPNERCNARCLMCDSWKSSRDYIDSKEIINILTQLKRWIKSDFFLQIAGGEPLIFKNIYDIFSFCSDSGIVCKVSTNGIALTEKNCDRIIKSGLPYLSISLDSHLPEIHNKFRGVDKALEKALKGIDYLSKNGNLTLGISSVLMKDNISTFSKSVEYFLQLPVDRLLIQPIRIWTEKLPVKRWSEYKYWINDMDILEEFTSYLIAKRKVDNRILNTEKDIVEWYHYFKHPSSLMDNQVKKCKIGYDKLSISYKGDISLGCGFYSPVGNIKSDKIKDVWYSDVANKTRKQMIKCQHPCTSNCYKSLSFKDNVAKARLFIKSGLFEKK